MLKRRTDLALEAKELWTESAEKETKLEGVRARDSLREGYQVTTVDILDEQGASSLGKPVGSYVTVQLDALARREEDAFGRAARAIAAELNGLLKLPEEATCLVVGLGNRAITPDAIGPGVADHTMVTRHLVEQAPEHFGSFRPVAALAAGVLGTTGVESGELVKAVAEKIRPGCIIAVDALASRSMDRVCTTVQLANTGIVPGSGVGNHRAALNRETLGVPVIAVGVPTVVDAGTLAADILAEAGQEGLDPEALAGAGEGLMVTPRDIDQRVADLVKVIGYGINLALQPGLTIEAVDLFLSGGGPDDQRAKHAAAQAAQPGGIDFRRAQIKYGAPVGCPSHGEQRVRDQPGASAWLDNRGCGSVSEPIGLCGQKGSARTSPNPGAP